MSGLRLFFFRVTILVVLPFVLLVTIIWTLVRELWEIPGYIWLEVLDEIGSFRRYWSGNP